MAKVKKEKHTVYEGKVFIQATFNNTIVTVTDMKGAALSWCSAGQLGYRGAKKSTPFVAQSCTETAIAKTKDYGLQEVHVYVKGPGMGREAAVRTLGNLGLRVKSIYDVTPIPHNGCRPPKARRI